MANHFALVFPGQGSQSLGMLKDIATQYGEVDEVFGQASIELGYNLWQLCQEGPAEELDKTEHTQPALLAASYAIWRILQNKCKVTPAFFAGHSLGEYTALVCANAMEFRDAVRLVALRGQYMQEAVAMDTGAMAAVIGLGEEEVRLLCKDAASDNEILSPANFNSIGQIVIAGHKSAVMRAVALAKERGAKLAMLIPVSVPSHCQLMQPAAAKLEKELEKIALSVPEIPVINNVDVCAYESTAAIREGLVKQLYSPVRWVEIIQYFIHQGITKMIECGPGKVLTGLNKRIDKNLTSYITADKDSLEKTLLELNI